VISGSTLDYFSGDPLDHVGVETDGLDPLIATGSRADAKYRIEVAVGSKLFLVSYHDGYRTTRSPAVFVEDVPITQDVYTLSVQDVRNQYTLLGKVPTPGTAFVAAELVTADGTPIDGLPLTAITVLDANNAPVAGVLGPYQFSTAGAIDPLATVTLNTGGRSRVAFFDVPQGTFTLAVTYTEAGAPTTVNTLFTAYADGATLALMGAGGAGTLPPSNTDPTFAADIYPRLQRAKDGGLGCANCHTALGPAAVLPYDDDVDTVYANIMGTPGVLAPAATASASLLLLRPLYEQPPLVQDHPNATFLDVNDPDYQRLLLWITNGAKP
jgi:hypothetical protein